MSVCAQPGCPAIVERGYCPKHERARIRSAASEFSRNHRGVPRRLREHGAPYDRLAREFAGKPCELRLPGCTGVATGADLIVPRSKGGRAVRENARPACRHCQSVQGGRLARAG